ncbi:hypothetical protein [Sphingomonas dokdonensis]|uniref:Uncharacterized protein n=1 Tax=Sphingomonas dokdonensis TaxID=344880 RepID=A0A245ZFB7_9SPHN|nr:hypothetical protein [Sphingomonas dokdonensis]OWK28419.1 hypothetical protein SPDO_28210 [Sphingomonas dokdonensis]
MADPDVSFRYGNGASYDEADPLAQILPPPAAIYEEADPLPLTAPEASDEQPIFFTRVDAGTPAERRLLRN